MTDPVVEQVRDLLLRRSQIGISKYGTTLGANYVQCCINRLDGK